MSCDVAAEFHLGLEDGALHVGRGNGGVFYPEEEGGVGAWDGVIYVIVFCEEGWVEAGADEG